MASTAFTGSGLDSMKLACISGRYLRYRVRAVVQSFASAARVSAAISCGISLEATETTPTPPSAMTGSVTASSPEKTRKCFRDGADRFGNLSHVAAGFFHAHDVGNLGETRQSRGFEVRGGTSGDVVEDDGLVADRFSNRLEMAVLALLRRLVVVGVRGEDRVHAGARGKFFGFLDGVVSGVGRGSGNDGESSGRDLDGRVDDVQPFVVVERGSLAGGAAGHKKIDAGLDLPRDQIAQSRVVDGTIRMKGSYECSATATELHRNKITRMGAEGKLPGCPDVVDSYSSRHTSLKS